MTDTIYGVYKTNDYNECDLWASFRTQKEAFDWISKSRFHEKYAVQVIPATKENLDYLYQI